MFLDFFKKEKTETIDKTASYSCEVIIDFAGLNAVSIERQVDDDGLEHTVIGYINGDIQEWYVYCNRDIHSTLCKQFVDYLRLKYNDSRETAVG